MLTNESLCLDARDGKVLQYAYLLASLLTVIEGSDLADIAEAFNGCCNSLPVHSIDHL